MRCQLADAQRDDHDRRGDQEITGGMATLHRAIDPGGFDGIPELPRQGATNRHGRGNARRYWKPLTGQIWKKATGTRIQASSSFSRQERSRQSRNSPSSAAAISRMPIASGTVWR